MPLGYKINGVNVEETFATKQEIFDLQVDLPVEYFTWGSNSSGQLGLGDTTNRSTPTVMNSDRFTWEYSFYDFNLMALNPSYLSKSDNHGSAISSYDGSLITWGSNSSGQLGLGDTTNRSTPTSVGFPPLGGAWTQTWTSGYNTFAQDSSGRLYGCGDNSYGQLGLGDTTTRSALVQVDNELGNNFAYLDCGTYHVAGIRQDGTLWMWGLNTSGQLGLGFSSTNISTPLQVGGLSSWVRVSTGIHHTLAIMLDGSLWSWGSNSYGQLGSGAALNRSSPVQVGSLQDWVYVKASPISNFTYSLALKSNGTLWAWGNNNNGRLGLGDTIHRSSPVQVGSLQDWMYATTNGSGATFAIRKDGTLWAWGDNTGGQLGLGDTIHRSSPVQVTGAYGVCIEASGTSATFAAYYY